MNRIDFWEGNLHFEVSGEDAETLRANAAELATEAPAFVQSLAEVAAAARAVNAFAKKSEEVKPAPPVNKGTQPGKSDIPNCECGIPMTDLRGKTYQRGAKKGQPYRFSFYHSNDCTANCEARN